MGTYQCKASIFVPRSDRPELALLRQDNYGDGFDACLSAAHAGIPEAQVVVSWMMLVRADRNEDLGLARSWLRMHADNGCTYAAYALAWLLFVEKLPDMAFTYMSRAAAEGFPAAVVDLGRFYEAGIGTRRDVTKARMQYVAGAKCGHVLARLFLCQLNAASSAVFLERLHAKLLRWPLQTLSALRLAKNRHENVGLFFRR